MEDARSAASSAAASQRGTMQHVATRASHPIPPGTRQSTPSSPPTIAYHAPAARPHSPLCPLGIGMKKGATKPWSQPSRDAIPARGLARNRGFRRK